VQVRAYVINLKNRVDRWESVLQQSEKLGLPITRIEAVGKGDLEENDEVFVVSGVAATWKSHQLAMATFLESSDKYGLIMEDDFLLTHSWHFRQLSRVIEISPDFFQFGYLVTSPIDRLELILANSFDLFLKVLNRVCSISYRLQRKLGTRLLILEQSGLPLDFVPNDIRAGGQAYLVSRKFAEASRYINKPAFTSADGIFMALGDVRSFRMFRFRKVLIAQTSSPTSVDQRYL
jgi:GR25 family glycosyltransferase involved in LPS biosynthesis